MRKSSGTVWPDIATRQRAIVSWGRDERAFLVLRNTMAPGDQVKDQHYKCKNQQKVDYSTTYMQAEAE
jgi:hypothetical protein